MTRRDEVRQWVTEISEFAAKHQPDKVGEEWANYIKETLERLDKMTEEEVIAQWGLNPLSSIGISSSGDVNVIGQNIFDPESIAALMSLIKKPGLPASTFGEPMEIGEERKVVTSNGDVIVVELKQVIRGTPGFNVSRHDPQMGSVIYFADLVCKREYDSEFKNIRINPDLLAPDCYGQDLLYWSMKYWDRFPVGEKRVVQFKGALPLVFQRVRRQGVEIMIIDSVERQEQREKAIEGLEQREKGTK